MQVTAGQSRLIAECVGSTSFGGDWPMTIPDGGYQPTWQVMNSLLGELSAAEQNAILGGTASRVYGIR